MAYCRGASSLFDEWATLSGNPGLAWNSLFQDFLEVSSYRDPPGADYEQFVNKSAYGNGPLEVSRSSGLTGFEFPFAAAIKSQLGLQEADLSDGTGIGVDLGVASIYAESRTRSYARKAFGNPIWVRPNVQVIVNAWVSKINFSGKRATSVTYHSPDGTVTTVKGKEFIISGGSINTPKLLMLSGVGPKKQLSALRIPVVADIPAVGSNLRDHAFSIAEVEVTPDIITVFDIFFNSTEEAIAQEQYNTNSSGPLGWNNGFVYAGFRLPDSVWDGINGTHYTTLPKDRPHILLEFSTVPFINTNVSAITTWASLVQPESSGYVALNTSNFKDDPLIFTNFYKSEADKAAIMAGYKQLRALFGQSALKEKVVAQLFPGPDVTTDQQIWATIQKQTYSFHHPVGTVAIGKALNSNWRLKGLNGIRVVDSSTFPYPTTCHPQAVVYALANRAGKDIIREDNH
jgi:choline dehydrogenase